VLEQRLAEAHVVIVLWSASSIRSGFVRDESTRALEAGKLLPVRIEPVVPPLGFGQIHALDLFDWDGAHDDAAFAAIVDEVGRRFGQIPVPRAPSRPPRPAWRRRGALLVAALVLAVAAAVGGWQAWVSSESRRNLQLGLEQQFGREPNLQAARNYYLDALAHRPGNARARYYLAHVYAQLGETELARTSFERALRDRQGLDDAQLADASARVKAMTPGAEPAALARRAEPATGAAAGKTASGSLGGLGSLGSLGGVFTGPTATLAKLPRIAPPADVRERVSTLVARMFGDDSEGRVTATTALVTDPELLSDAVPLAVDRALDRLAASAGKPSAALQAGVANTLVLLQAASPGTLTVHRADIERLLQLAAPLGQHTAAQADKLRAQLAAAAKQRPVALIQIANEAQRPIAETLAVRLRAAGYDTPPIELVGVRAPANAAIHVQGRSDHGLARWVARVAGEAGGEAVAMQTLRNAHPRTDTFEIWFDRDLCTPARNLPTCAA